MNSFLRSFVAVTFVALMGNAYGFETPEPTDSTTSIVDKTASLYILEEGKTLYGEGRVKDALVKFRQAGVKDPNSWRAAFWISKCHYRMNNYGYALKYADDAVKLADENINKEVYFSLAEAHHRLGNIDSALVNYEIANDKLSKIRATELNVEHLIEECKFAKEQMAKEPAYTKVRLEGYVNSGYDDYNPILADNGKTIYFVSRRSNTTGGGMNPADQTYFEDVYKATWSEELSEWDEITNKLGKINSDGFDALSYISPDGLTGYMTLNTTATDMSKTTRGSDICELKMSNKGEWNSPKIINNKSINTSFFDGNATLTADGNTMYFISDRKGDKSMSDIYVVEKNGKSWGTAKALPMTVNTKGRETTPFITPDGRYLFFSSDGHTGMGGYDVYVVENQGDSWGTPVNLGHGINTVNNDTHFSYTPSLKKAFIAGFELVGDKSSIDIYHIDFTNFEFPK